MLYNIPILYPLGFFETFFAFSNVITNNFTEVTFLPDLEQVFLNTKSKKYYIYNDILDINLTDSFSYFNVDWMLLYPILTDISSLKTEYFHSLNIEFNKTIIKDNLRMSLSSDYWSVFPRYIDNNNFNMFYYFNISNIWTPLDFLFEFELTPSHIFLTTIIPAVAENLIIGTTKCGLLPEYLVFDQVNLIPEQLMEEIENFSLFE